MKIVLYYKDSESHLRSLLNAFIKDGYTTSPFIEADEILQLQKQIRKVVVLFSEIKSATKVLKELDTNSHLSFNVLFVPTISELGSDDMLNLNRICLQPFTPKDMSSLSKKLKLYMSGKAEEQSIVELEFLANQSGENDE